MTQIASYPLRKKLSEGANYHSFSVYDSLSISDIVPLFSVTEFHGARFSIEISYLLPNYFTKLDNWVQCFNEVVFYVSDDDDAAADYFHDNDNY
jgi:hypothetical protein